MTTPVTGRPRATTGRARPRLRTEQLEDRTTPATLFIPQDLAVAPGGTVTVPVRFTSEEVGGSDVGAADFAISFDTARFDASNVRVTGTALDGFTIDSAVIDDAAGTVSVQLTGPAGTDVNVPNGQTVTLLQFDLTAAPGAAAGDSVIDLEESIGAVQTNVSSSGGQAAVLNPPPTNNETDTVDGLVTVTGPAGGPTVVSVTAVTPTPRNTPAGTVDVTFSEAVDPASLDAADVTLTRNGTAVDVSGLTFAATADPAVFTLNGLAALTADEGAYVLTVRAAGVNDTGGTAGSGESDPVSFTVDTTAPAAPTVAPVAPDPRNTPVDTVTVTFATDIDPTTVGVDDLTLTRNGAAVALTGVTITETAEPGVFTIDGLGGATGLGGVYELTVNAAGTADLAGNAGAGTVVETFTVDTTAPQLTDVIDVAPDPRNTGVDTVEITFSEPIDAATVTAAAVTLTRDGVAVPLTNVTVTPTGTPGRFVIGGLAPFTAASGVYVLTVDGTGALDLAGNAATETLTDQFTVDATGPAAVAVAAVTPDPRNAPVDAVEVTVAADVDPATVSAADLTLTRDGVDVPLTNVTVTPTGTAGVFTVAGLGALTGTAGTYVLTLTGAGVADALGNAGTGTAADTFVVDLTGPTVTTVSQPAANGNVTVTFSEAIVAGGLDAADLTLTRNGAAVPLSNLTFTPTADPAVFTVGGLAPLVTDPGTYVLTVAGTGVTDPATNPGTGTGEATFTVVTTAITTASGSPTNAATVTFAVTFSEPVQGVDAADFVVNTTGGTGTPTVQGVTGDGATYEVTVAVPAGADTGFTLGFAPNGSVTTVGNGTAVGGATGPAVTADRLGPVGRVVQAAGQADPAPLGPVAFTVTFDEAVTGLTAADFTVTGPAGAAVTAVTGADTTYQVTVDGATDGGPLTLALNAGAVADALGNPSTTDPTGDATVTLDAVTPPPADNLVTVGGQPGGVSQTFRAGADGKLTPVGAAVTPFPGFTGVVRSTTGDVDGDGTLDTVYVTGPGTPLRMTVVSGAAGNAVLVPATAPFSGSEGFAGGGFVAAADFDGDGRAEVVVTPDQGGGPRVTIFGVTGANNALAVRANFLGIDDANFRGGARPAAGDVNGDGTPDLAVAAGFEGGPRVALFNGTTLLGGTPARLTADFFAFPGEDATRLRNGVFVAIGDVTGDGFGDLVFGGGPGGAPRVYILNGQQVVAGQVGAAQTTPIANFFVADNTADRGGVRVATADADGDARADVVVGSGAGSPARVRTYLGSSFTAGLSGEPTGFQDLTPFGGAVLTDGIFVS